MHQPLTRTFNDLYTHELEMVLSAEAQLVKLLPRLAEETDTPELQQAFATQAAACEEQRKRLQTLLNHPERAGLHSAVLETAGRVPVCRGMESLLEECTELLRTFARGNLRDAVMIAHMQRAEHYKMAAYASLHDYAHLLGFKDDAQHLAHAGRAVTGMSRNLGAIAIQVNAEAYVDTRIEKT